MGVAADLIDIAEAVDWAWDEGMADILSNSWGLGPGNCTLTGVDFNNIIDAYDRARDQGRGGLGSIVVFSSGNHGSCISFPRNINGAITVGAINNNGQIWNYSNTGPEMDLVAPSGATNLNGNVRTTDRMGANGYETGNYTSRFGGTSAAAPQVAGVAALMLSANPDLTEVQVRTILQQTATDMGPAGFDNTYGFGLVNAHAAVRAAFPISGPDYLCSTNTFTLQNAPAGSTVNWTAEPGSLFSNNPPSGSGTSAVLSPYSSFASGQATITFTIESACAEVQVQKSFWVGRPSVPGAIIGNTNPSIGSLATYMVPSLPSGATSMSWVLPYCFGCSQPWSFWSGQNSTQMVAQVGDPAGYVQAMGNNACGNGGASLLYVTPDGGGCGSCPIQIVHPNPASDELTLTFADPGDGKILQQEVEPYEVSLYDIHGSKMYEAQSSEPVFRMDVSRLKNGFYYLHILNRYGLTRKQIRVEK